jgi:salicylate hydroxylase
MALEDGWALADCLAALPLDQALPAYQARRRARAERIVAASSGNAWVYHMWRGPQRWALHQGIRAFERFAPRGWISRFDWIYDHDETLVIAEA